MFSMQRMLFVVGVIIAVSLLGTVVALVLDRLFPGNHYLTLAGPLVCVFAAMGLARIYFGMK